MTKNKNNQSIAKRLSAYSALAAGTVVAGGSANAAEVVHDLADLTAVNGGNDEIKFNLVKGTQALGTDFSAGTSSFVLRVFNDNGFLEGPESQVAYSTMNAVQGVGSLWQGYVPGADLLGSGSTVDTAPGNFAIYTISTNIVGLGSAPNPTYGGAGSKWGFAEGQTGFVGLRFDFDADEGFYYGWAEITRDADGDSYTLHHFGYNDERGTASVIPVASGGEDVAITTISVSDGTATITIKGKANTEYTCKDSTTLSGFTAITPTSGSTTTDDDGVATFQVAAPGVDRFYLVDE